MPLMMAMVSYFYDAAAPIIDVNTIDMSKVYLKSRYDREKLLISTPNDQARVYGFP